MFQIEEYESIRFLRWGLTREWLAHRAVWLGLAVGVLALSVAAVLPAARTLAIAVAWLASGAAAQLTWRWTSPKRPLVMTARMRRLLIAGGFLAVILAAGVALGIVDAASDRLGGARPDRCRTGHEPERDPAGCCQCRHQARGGADPPALPRLAAAKLRQVDPTVLAVVGSFGKTSTKHILAQLLQPSVNTLPTRKSFNTLMGVSRAINEDLKPEHRVFVVEMDAYAQGEIAAISELVHPTHRDRHRDRTAAHGALRDTGPNRRRDVRGGRRASRSTAR